MKATALSYGDPVIFLEVNSTVRARTGYVGTKLNSKVSINVDGGNTLDVNLSDPRFLLQEDAQKLCDPGEAARWFDGIYSPRRAAEIALTLQGTNLKREREPEPLGM